MFKTIEEEVRFQAKLNSERRLDCNCPTCLRRNDIDDWLSAEEAVLNNLPWPVDKDFIKKVEGLDIKK